MGITIVLIEVLKLHRTGPYLREKEAVGQLLREALAGTSCWYLACLLSFGKNVDI